MAWDRANWLRRLAWGAGILLLLTLLAWLGVPPLLKWQTQKQLSELLGRQVTLGEVSYRPWSLEIEVRDIAIAGAAPDQPLLSVKRVYVNLQASSLWYRAPVVEALQIDAPTLRVARLEAGRYDIDDLIRKFEPKPDATPSEPAHFALHNLELRDGALLFDDKRVGRVHELRGLGVALPFLSNLPADVTVTVQPRLAFVLNGAAFDSGVQATPFAKGRKASLKIDIGGHRETELDLAPYLGYLPESLPVRVQRGRIAVTAEADFAQRDDGTPELSVKGDVRVSDLAVTDTKQQLLLAWRQLGVNLRDVQPLLHKLALGPVQLEGAQLHVRRDPQGRINLASLAAASAAGPAAPAPPASAAADASASSADAAASPPASAASAPAGAVPDAWQLSVESLAVSDTRVHWDDASTQPAAALVLDGITAGAKSLAWPVAEAVPMNVSAVLRAAGDGGAALGRLSADGQATDREAKLNWKADELALNGFAPYVAQVLVPRLEGQAGAHGTLHWQAADTPRIRLGVEEARLDGLRLIADALPETPETQEAAEAPARRRRAPASGDVVSLQQLRLAKLDVDLAARSLTLGSLALQAPAAQIERDRDGRWNALQWLRQPAEASDAAPPPAAAEHAGWQLQLGRFELDGGQLRFFDAAPRASEPGGPRVRPARLNLSQLQVALEDFRWPQPAAAATGDGMPSKLQFSTTLGRPPAAGERAVPAANQARIEWQGQFGLQPLAAKGTAQVQRFPVQAVVPYVGKPLRLTLARALLGYRGEVAARDTGKGYDASASGDVLVTDLSVLNQPASPQVQPEELLSWQALALKQLRFSMAPAGKPKIDIGQAELSDFYSRLVITEQGRFNLQVAAAGEGEAKALEPAASTEAAAAPGSAVPASAGPASAAPPQPAGSAASAGPPPGAELPIELTIGGIQLRNGKVDFADRFVRPNYSAQLTELNGSLGAFRSGSTAMAALDLRGRAAGTALLEITGQLNPTADPLALDIRAKATDLELAPLSPYAGKYAGYAIERGKLSMDISYNIQPDGRLEAKNQVILNQLTFGDKVDSPTATKLPVLLAVALLKDRNGVIDINLPISGSINDPQFSVFGLVLRVIGNLLVKALTSPFALLTGGGGGPGDSGVVEFHPGTASVVEGSREVIDKVAKALEERPALTMTVAGAADPNAEREAYRAAALERRLMEERRKELARSGTVPPPTITLGTADRARLLEEVYDDTRLPDKPRNMIGIAKSVPPAEMEQRLRAVIPVTDEAMRELAVQRGLAVRDALIAKGLSSDRLFLAAPRLHGEGDKDKDWTPRVQLTLSTN